MCEGKGDPYGRFKLMLKVLKLSAKAHCFMSLLSLFFLSQVKSKKKKTPVKEKSSKASSSKKDEEFGVFEVVNLSRCMVFYMCVYKID